MSKLLPERVTHIFIDIVGFTKDRGTDTQTQIIQRLNKFVKKAINTVGIKGENIIYIPTGDGMCISINEEHKYEFDFQIKIACELLRLIEKYNLTITHNNPLDNKKFNIRIGINESIDNKIKDINKQNNYSGKGINYAARLESIADEKQILVGKSIYDILHQREEYIGKFIHYPHKIKHNYPLDVYQYIENATYLNVNKPDAIDDLSVAEKAIMDEYNNPKKDKNPYSENSDNIIILESHDCTTLLHNGIEIMTKRFKIKILKSGEFKFSFDFDAPDDNSKLTKTKYINTKQNNRFKKTSYNYHTKSSLNNTGYLITSELKDIDDNLDENGNMKEKKDQVEDSKWIRNVFSKPYAEEGEIIDIFVSISHEFNLTNKEDINKYFQNTFSSPHAIRNVTFQIEKYNLENDLFSQFIPILKNSKEEILSHKYDEDVYYRRYSWEVYYNEDDTKTLHLTIDNM